VGLRSKQYCILNKQYSKEDYEAMVPKILEHMNAMPYEDSKGRQHRYGEYFPIEISPFPYNDTIAQEFFPLSKEDAAKLGYPWKDSDSKTHTTTTEAAALPDNIAEADDGILRQVIACEHKGKCNDQCSVGFKITPQELQFYRQLNVPLPRLCSNCRHYDRLKQRNPLKLWQRACQCAGQTSDNSAYKNDVAHFHGEDHCPSKFQTPYAPDRPEIVYCEQCYQAEVS
jgi:hypothetical protein